MKIEKREWRVTILIIIFVGLIFLLNYKSLNEGRLWPWIVSYVFVSLLLITRLFLRISEEKIEKMKRIIGNTGSALLMIAGGTILGIKLKSFLAYLIAAIGAYLLISNASRVRNKVLEANEDLKREVDRKLKKRQQKK